MKQSAFAFGHLRRDLHDREDLALPVSKKREPAAARIPRPVKTWFRATAAEASVEAAAR